MHRTPVGVFGASGYAGRELCGLIQRHPQLSLAFATANAQRGETAEVPGGGRVTFVATEDAPLADAQLIFSSLPHGASAEWVMRARAAGAKVVDLSHDLRIGNTTEDVVYGMTELNRSAIRGADLVANPGCYPTSILMALVPLFAAGVVAPGASINISAASGVTGAGISPKVDLLFGEITESFKAYGIGNGHRHLNEMRAMLARWNADADLIFTPHLLPTARGILSTITVPLTRALDDPMALHRAQFGAEPFIEFSDASPELKHVNHRNVVRIHAQMLQQVRTPTLLVISAIDNLMKGAAGQALQNANLMLGFDETLGLPR